MRCLRWMLTTAFVWCASIDAHADDAPANNTVGKSVLITVKTSSSIWAKSLDNRFIQELELTLDQFSIRSIAAQADFRALPFSKQLNLLKRRAERMGAVAAVWIDHDGPDHIEARLLTFGNNAVVLRTIRVNKSATALRELALTTLELLDPTQLSGLSNGKIHTTEIKIAESLPLHVPSDTLGRSRKSFDAALLVSTSGGSALYGHVGPSMKFGFGVGGEIQLPSGLFFSGLIWAGSGPYEVSRDTRLFLWGFLPELAAGYRLQLNAFSIGAMVGAGASWTLARITFNDFGPERVSFFRFAASAGLDLRYAVTNCVRLSLGFRTGVYAHREQFKRTSSDEIFLRTPFVDWCIIAGCVFLL